MFSVLPTLASRNLFYNLNLLMFDSILLLSLMNKISEMEEAFEKSARGKKGKKSIDVDAPDLSRGNQRKVNEFMADLRGVMVS